MVLVAVVEETPLVLLEPELVLVTLPQFVPALHTHMPPEQRCPAPHVRPHPPQFWASDAVGMHAPSQKLWLAPQSTAASEPESPLAHWVRMLVEKRAVRVAQSRGCFFMRRVTTRRGQPPGTRRILLIFLTSHETALRSRR